MHFLLQQYREMLLTDELEEGNLLFTNSPGEGRVIPKMDPVPTSSCSSTVKNKSYRDTEVFSHSCDKFTFQGQQQSY